MEFFKNFLNLYQSKRNYVYKSQDTYKAQNKMVERNPTISVIRINIKGLYSPIRGPYIAICFINTALLECSYTTCFTHCPRLFFVLQQKSWTLHLCLTLGFPSYYKSLCLFVQEQCVHTFNVLDLISWESRGQRFTTIFFLT